MPAGAGISLVQAVESDAELLFSYMQQLRHDDPMPRHEFASDAAVKDALESLIINPEIGRIWMIRAGELAVGYAALSFFHSLEFAGRCGLLDEFFIHHDHRRRGIARAALKWICATAAPKLGIRAVFLELWSGNMTAAKLYESSGFAPRPYCFLVKEI